MFCCFARSPTSSTLHFSLVIHTHTHCHSPHFFSSLCISPSPSLSFSSLLSCYPSYPVILIQYKDLGLLNHALSVYLLLAHHCVNDAFFTSPSLLTCFSLFPPRSPTFPLPPLLWLLLSFLSLSSPRPQSLVLSFNGPLCVLPLIFSRRSILSHFFPYQFLVIFRRPILSTLIWFPQIPLSKSIFDCVLPPLPSSSHPFYCSALFVMSIPPPVRSGITVFTVSVAFQCNSSLSFVFLFLSLSFSFQEAFSQRSSLHSLFF